MKLWNYVMSSLQIVLTKKQQQINKPYAVMPELGSYCPQMFSKSGNPIQIGGGQIMPTNYHWPTVCWIEVKVAVLCHIIQEKFLQRSSKIVCILFLLFWKTILFQIYFWANLKIFKTLRPTISRFQGMYWQTHKTSTLTTIQ